jgi:hypothetical protein
MLPEETMTKDPLSISKPDDKTLDSMSRARFDRIYCFRMSVQGKPIGLISPVSRGKLLRYCGEYEKIVDPDDPYLSKVTHCPSLLPIDIEDDL